MTAESAALAGFRDSIERGDDWFDALLEAIACWEAPGEEIGGRSYRYLLAGEAFDWLLLAERLCEEANGAIPAGEREDLLFFGRLPRDLDEAEFKRAIGSEKHRAHLNFLYGVTTEEALQLTMEEEVLKEQRNRAWDQGDVEDLVFERLYGRSCEQLLATFRQERALADGDDISYGELREFTYWLFKFRMRELDPARVASDTRKALARVSELEAAATRRRAQLDRPAPADAAFVLDGEVVAHLA